MLTQLVSLSSCKNEEDDLFDSSAAERLMQAEKDYTARLASSEGGWAFEYYPTTETINPNEEAEADYLPQGLGYLMMAKFSKDNSVVVGMNNPFTYNVYQEDKSVWQVISDNGPVLTFNTYNNVLHTFSSPYPFYNSLGSGDNGTGVGGDYEFVIIDCKEDAQQVTLKGKKRGTYNYLYRLPAGTDFAEYIEDIKKFTNTLFPSNAINYDCMHVGSKTFNIVDMASGDPNIYPADGDVIADQSFHPYLIVKKNDGKYYIHFRDLFKVEEEDAAVQEFVYDDDSQRFICTSNEEYTITGPDAAAFFRSTFEANTTWNMTASTEKSESVSTIYTSMASQFKKLNATLNNVSLKRDGERVALNITYRVKQSSTATYYFTLNPDKISFTYEGPKNDAAKNVLNSVPAIGDLMNILQSELVVSPATNPFVLNSVKLTSGNDWFVLSK